MPSSFTKKLFSHWLKSNSHRFNVNPYIEKSRKDHFYVKFSGVTDQICCHFGPWQVEVWAQYEGDPELCDIVAEFDLSEARNASGQYYCKSCLEAKLYDSREELWIEHSFKPLAEWVNKKLTDSTSLCFSQMDGGGSCWVELLPTEKVEEYRQKEYFVAAAPVLKIHMQQ